MADPEVLVSSDESGLLTVDQLAERARTTVRNIRYYASRGLLPPPQLRGRTGLYGPTHVARLELVAELSALGFTLAAIERRLAQVPLSAGPEELSLQLALMRPWAVEDLQEIDRAELDRQAGRPLSEADIARLAAFGVITVLDDGRLRAESPAVAVTALDSIDYDLPLEFWERSRTVIEQHTAALAEDLMKLFQDEVLQPYRDAGRPPEQRSRLATALARLKPMTVQGVLTAFGRAVNRTIREKVDGQD